VKGKNNQLAPESLAAYHAINLHFHDLRREFGSRVLESGSSLIEACDLLGHANISQSSTYLNPRRRHSALPLSARKNTSEK
jgi:site-specific recombinase XerC